MRRAAGSNWPIITRSRLNKNDKKIQAILSDIGCLFAPKQLAQRGLDGGFRLCRSIPWHPVIPHKEGRIPEAVRRRTECSLHSRLACFSDRKRALGPQQGKGKEPLSVVCRYCCISSHTQMPISCSVPDSLSLYSNHHQLLFQPQHTQHKGETSTYNLPNKAKSQHRVRTRAF